MTKKESDKDSDRPHYYSQFWLDVAAGRRVIGTPRTDEGEADDLPEPLPVSSRRPLRSTLPDADGYHETVVHPQIDAELDEDADADADAYSTPDLETFDMAEDIEDEDEGLLTPAFGANEDDFPDVDFSAKTEAIPAEESDEDELAEAIESEEDFYDEEDEDEEDDSWAARGRKKPKPGRQAKLPSKPPARRPKREPRRGF